MCTDWCASLEAISDCTLSLVWLGYSDHPLIPGTVPDVAVRVHPSAASSSTLLLVLLSSTTSSPFSFSHPPPPHLLTSSASSSSVPRRSRRPWSEETEESGDGLDESGAGEGWCAAGVKAELVVRGVEAASCAVVGRFLDGVEVDGPRRPRRLDMVAARGSRGRRRVTLTAEEMRWRGCTATVMG